jgi:uncharacterized protein (DUF1330 family)
MPAYYIGEHKISDAALFDDYLAKVVPMVERFGGRYLTKAGSHEILEGDWKPNRVVIIEFPDIASIPSTGIPTIHRTAQKRSGGRNAPRRRVEPTGLGVAPV